jgi:TonB-linked SusC/RagA family outer membrane protein
MKKISLLLAFLGFIGLQVVFAQTRALSGVVTSGEDGSSIPGASVVVKGTTMGTVTDMDGKFTLKVPTSAKTLSVSFVGMTSADIPITGSNTYTIKLKSEATSINEVVVTALGQTTSKAKVGYSTATFSSDAINKDGAVSLMSGISGKIAGANISNLGGPGSSSKVVLRGYGIIGGGNNQPLYVIDGVPLSDDRLSGTFTSSVGGTSDFGNGMTNINPNDVESISVLKGTAAASLYGSSAKNGVVMITTKRGKSGNLKVEYNGSFSLSEVGKLPDMQSEFGQGWAGSFILSENGSWGPRLDGKMRPWGAIVDNSQLIKPFSFVKNNIRNFYDVGTEANNSIAISGGTDISKFFFSYSNVTSDGVIPTKADYLQRNTFALRTNSDFKNFSFNTSFNYVNRKQNSPLTGQGGADGATVFESLLQIPVDIPITDFRHYKNKFMNVDNFFTPYAENPYYALNENGITQNADRFFGNVDLKYKFLKSLFAQFRLGGDFNNSRTFGWAQPNAPSPGSWNAGGNVEGQSRVKDVGSVLQSSDYFGTINADFIVNYSKDLNVNFNLDATVGTNYFQSSIKNELAYITNLSVPGLFNLSNSTAPPITNDFHSLKRRIGIYGTATLGYKSQLFLTGNIRNDWSSTLPINDNSIFYYGLNGSWVVTKSLDLTNTPISFMKLRTGYGQTGSDPDPYQVNSALRLGNVPLGYGSLTAPFNGTPAWGVSNTINNPVLKPILTKEFEAGAEIKFFKNRVGVDFTYYDKITTGQIFVVPIAASSGYSGAVENIGQVSNKGVELAVDIKPIDTKNFSWAMIYTFSRNVNNVDKLSGTLPNVLINSSYDAESRATVGKPVGEIYALVPLLSPDGKIVVNAAGQPQAAQEKGDYGSSQYKYMMGLNNTFNYKNFQLAFSLDFRYGGVMYSGTADLLLFTGNAKATTYNDRRPFIVPNSVVASTNAAGVTTYTENKTVIDEANYVNYFYPTSNPGTSYNQRIFDKSFLKMRDISFSYRLPSSFISRIKANQMIVGVYARNLLLWTPASNMYVDPEGTNLGNDLAGELGEFRAAPTSKSLGVNLKITF